MLQNLIFPTKTYQIFTTTSHYSCHSAIYSLAYFAAVHSRVTVGGCLMDYEYKVPCQFTMTVGGTRCYLLLKKARATHCRAT